MMRRVAVAGATRALRCLLHEIRVVERTNGPIPTTWRLAVAFKLSGPRGVGYLQYAKYAK
eukprot:3805263-Prymnesium_polylepis.1